MLLRIEMDRGNGWELRQEGDVASQDGLIAHVRRNLLALAIQFPHRALLNGVPVAQVTVAEARDHFRNNKLIPKHARRYQ
jgi:hypothetical protein